MTSIRKTFVIHVCDVISGPICVFNSAIFPLLKSGLPIRGERWAVQGNIVRTGFGL